MNQQNLGDNIIKMMVSSVVGSGMRMSSQSRQNGHHKIPMHSNIDLNFDSV